jgi:hypothetical protein
MRRGGGAAELRHPTGGERMGSSTLQSLQEPILLTPGLLSGLLSRWRFSKDEAIESRCRWVLTHTAGGTGVAGVQREAV